MVLQAFIYAGAFVFTLGVTGLLVWRGIDEVVTEVRPLRGHSLAGGAPCPRCRKLGLGPEGRCGRCGLRVHSHGLRVEGVRRGFALADKVDFGHYVQLWIDTAERRRIAVVAPVGLAVRPGDAVELMFDDRDRLREFNNLTLGTGWRLPLRIIGQRSPVAVTGLLFAVPAVTMLILAAPIYFLYKTLARSYDTVSRVVASGAQTAPHPTFGSGEIAAVLLYLVGLTVFGGLVMLARTRPRINRDVLR